MFNENKNHYDTSRGGVFIRFKERPLENFVISSRRIGGKGAAECHTDCICAAFARANRIGTNLLQS